MFRYRMDTTAILILLGIALALTLVALDQVGIESHGIQAETGPVQVAYGTRGG